MSIEQAGAAAGGAAYEAAKVTGAQAIVGSVGVLGAVTLVTVLVMVMKRPRTVGEWVVGLISTVVSSICGGAAIVLYMGLHRTLQSADPFEVYAALVVVGGVVFTAGLPGWVLVRIAFNTMTKYQDRTAVEIYDDFKGVKP